MGTTITGNNIVSAGKATATTADQSIEVLFNSISIINDGAEELQIAIEQDSTDGGSNVIYIGTGEAFEGNIRGSSLHYSVASSTSAFRYILNS